MNMRILLVLRYFERGRLLNDSRQVISKHRSFLTRHIPHRASEIRSLSPGQTIFLLMMQDVESMRSAAGLPSSLVSYFTNGSLNRQSHLIVCMESIADKVKFVFGHSVLS
jgi:phosphatidylinositol 4-kinase